MSGLRLILVRHGSTTATLERRYSGRGDVPLSALGREQARGAARRVVTIVDGAPVTAVISSPLSRCQETARTIAAGISSPAVVSPDSIHIEPDLIECDFGVWEGMTFADVVQQYPSEFETWLGTMDVTPPGGESFREVGARTGRLIEKMRSEHPSGLIIAVTHVSPIKLILRDALSAGDAFVNRCYLSPAGISVIDFYADGGVAVRSVNETGHLSG